MGDAWVPAPVDEIERYVDSRYLCVQKSAWRLVALPMHDAFPSIMRLRYHLPGEQTVIFDADDDLQQLIDNPVSNRSMLIGFFQFCAADPVITRDLTYANVPTILTYIRSRENKRSGKGAGLWKHVFCKTITR
jgi:hypothetical protein